MQTKLLNLPEEAHNEPTRNLIMMGVILSAMVFVIDIMTPRGIADGMFYIAVLFFSTLTNDTKFTTHITISSILLIITGYFFSPDAASSKELQIAIINRTLSISIVAFSGFVIVKNKKLKLKVDERTRQLKYANKELESFNFISSHDLQEPLRKIHNFVSVLVCNEEDHLTEQGRYYLKRLSDTAKQLQRLIEDLLAYSRTRTLISHFEMIELRMIVEEVITGLKETITAKNAIINIRVFCKAEVIPSQFRSMIYNLISNSLKFSDPEKQPEIIIRSQTLPGSMLGNPKLQPKTEYCHTTIIDNGIGFQIQYKEKIFEVFQRLHERDKYKGTGIGLAICRRIAENHNGLITATGQPGKGARFDIYFPAERKKEPSSQVLAGFPNLNLHHSIEKK